ncbi:Auxin-responsive protein SAUR36 [Cinnamomum micranthum f. kanehirae]|uniref:Auxin-responsive protein SAUR36 n=1 Tax=Cinnamomum micranthum f. kanehirae TaxID=337451 RepID=A0A3S3PHB8_9MAGN|nr:Auxin-responsive protein SAUR36 [Cinnamomum micranthum f. kanehirae]
MELLLGPLGMSQQPNLHRASCLECLKTSLVYHAMGLLQYHRLLKKARKWQKFIVKARRKISTSRTRRSVEAESCIKSVADKGHFVVYTIDGTRFMVPLAYLNNSIFIELFRLSEYQFGLPCNGPITIPCDSLSLKYLVSFIWNRLSDELEKALLTSIATRRCSAPPLLQLEQNHQQILMARKWQKFAVDARRRISISRTVRSEEVESCIRPLADKGHFIVYTIDDRRFMVPLAYLKNPILLELFRMSEEQFGLPCNGAFTMPCDAIFMDCVISLTHRHVSKDVGKALRLLKMARKWQKFTENARRRILTSRIRKSSEAELCIKSLPAKGHFVAYTIDGKRFMVPLAYLNSPIFIELFRMSEDQFGLPYDGPITMPCDGLFMEYVASFIRRRLSEDVEKALLTSIAMGRCSTPSMLQLEQNHQQILVHGF